jgi:hypothetical protein
MSIQSERLRYKRAYMRRERLRKAAFAFKPVALSADHVAHAIRHLGASLDPLKWASGVTMYVASPGGPPVWLGYAKDFSQCGLSGTITVPPGVESVRISRIG